MRYFYQMRIENRIRNWKRKKLFLMCLLELRMFKPEGHITFWRTRSGRWCVAQNALHFPKCFIGFRAIYRWSERRYSYQSTEHILEIFSSSYRLYKCPLNVLYINIVYFKCEHYSLRVKASKEPTPHHRMRFFFLAR